MGFAMWRDGSCRESCCGINSLFRVGHHVWNSHLPLDDVRSSGCFYFHHADPVPVWCLQLHTLSLATHDRGLVAIGD